MKDIKAVIVENKEIARDIHSLTFRTEEPIPFRAGQFANIGVGDGAHLLRRPIAICKAEDDKITLCFQLKGEGTKKLAALPVGNTVSVLLPLGNGFYIAHKEKKVALVGGGVGVFPMLSVLRQYGGSKKIYSYIGFRNADAVCCLDEFKSSHSLTVTTDDGSYGEKMNAVQAFVSDMGAVNPDVVLACGPTPMLRALKEAMQSSAIPCYVSLEERMGCGIGACLVCVCDKTDGQHARVCKDGPVFDIREVRL